MGILSLCSAPAYICTLYAHCMRMPDCLHLPCARVQTSLACPLACTNISSMLQILRLATTWWSFLVYGLWIVLILVACSSVLHFTRRQLSFPKICALTAVPPYHSLLTQQVGCPVAVVSCPLRCSVFSLPVNSDDFFFFLHKATP